MIERLDSTVRELSLKIKLREQRETEVLNNLPTDTQSIPDREFWDGFVSNHPAGHLLQTWAWGDLKARFGWQPLRLALVQDGNILSGAQILIRPVPPLFSIAYVPKGPLVDWAAKDHVKRLLAGLCALCRSKRAILLKIEPHAIDNDALRGAVTQHGFVVSQFSVQPPRTAVVDIGATEENILAAMKQKTRYNIRLATRKGVLIRQGKAEDLATFHRLLQITGQRDRFGIHSLDYFRAVFELFVPDRGALLLAEVQGEPVAGLIALVHGPTAFYLFGASSNAHREKMPTYLLQWEAIRWAKAHGCRSYDLWGIPDIDESVLEAEFSARSQDTSGLWGVYRFKRGFGGRITRALGAFDLVLNRPLYWAYRLWMSRRNLGIPT